VSNGSPSTSSGQVISTTLNPKVSQLDVVLSNLAVIVNLSFHPALIVYPLTKLSFTSQSESTSLSLETLTHLSS